MNKDENADTDDPDLHVELENKPLWDAFHSNGTEMVSEVLVVEIITLIFSLRFR